MALGKFQNVGYVAPECNGTTLHFDQACLQIFTKKNISFWSQYEECEGCKLLQTVNLQTTGSFVVKTFSPLKYLVRSDYGEICNGKHNTVIAKCFVQILFSKIPV